MESVGEGLNFHKIFSITEYFRNTVFLKIKSAANVISTYQSEFSKQFKADTAD